MSHRQRTLFWASALFLTALASVFEILPAEAASWAVIVFASVAALQFGGGSCRCLPLRRRDQPQ